MTRPPQGARVATPRVSVGGVPVTRFRMAQAIEALQAMIESGKRHQCITVAVWQLYLAATDPRYRKAVDDADMILCDGFPVLLASKFGSQPLPGIAAGVDTVPAFCERAARRGFSVFVLGSEPAILEAARASLERQFGSLRFGYYSPPFHAEFDESLSAQMIDSVNRFGPDLVYIALGTPKGEVWVNEHRAELDASVTLGVGGAFDVVGGVKVRAPRLIRRLGLEGIVRTLQDPQPRMARNIASARAFPAIVLRDLRAQARR